MSTRSASASITSTSENRSEPLALADVLEVLGALGEPLAESKNVIETDAVLGHEPTDILLRVVGADRHLQACRAQRLDRAPGIGKIAAREVAGQLVALEPAGKGGVARITREQQVELLEEGQPRRVKEHLPGPPALQAPLTGDQRAGDVGEGPHGVHKRPVNVERADHLAVSKRSGHLCAHEPSRAK